MKKDLRRAGFVSLTLGALGCGEPARPDAVRPLDLFARGITSTDSLNSEGWRKYLDPMELHRAWAPPADSPWRPYYKPTLIAAIATVRAEAMPVTNLAMVRQESQAGRFGETFDLGQAAVFVDLPGEQSVAWGAALRKAVGAQPVVLFNNWPHQFGLLRLERPLGALLYFAEVVAGTPPVAPSRPVFLLERSRLGQKELEPSSRDFDNRFFHPATDFPTAAAFRREGISQIFYVNPRGIGSGSEEDDLNEYFAELSRSGIQFTYVKAGGDSYEIAAARPFIRNTIFTRDSMADYATRTSTSGTRTHYYSYSHYSTWHSTYWGRSSGAWGGSGAVSGSGSGGGGFSS